MPTMHYLTSLLLCLTASSGTVIQEVLDREERVREKIKEDMRMNGNMEKKLPVKQLRRITFIFPLLLTTNHVFATNHTTCCLFKLQQCAHGHFLVEFQAFRFIRIPFNYKYFCNRESKYGFALRDRNDLLSETNTCLYVFLCNHSSAERKQSGKKIIEKKYRRKKIP